MEAFYVKILQVLLTFGLIAANVVNGSPLQRQLKKGKISNCSCFKNWNRIKNCMANWNNRNNKAQFEDRQTLPLTISLNGCSPLLSPFIDYNLFYDFLQPFLPEIDLFFQRSTLFPLLRGKQNISTVPTVFYFIKKNSLSFELSNVAHSLKWCQQVAIFGSSLMNYQVHEIQLITGNWVLTDFP